MHPPLQNPRHLLNTKVPLETIAFGISLITMMATPRISQLHKLSIICLQVATTGISGKPPARKIIMNVGIPAKSPASAWKKGNYPRHLQTDLSASIQPPYMESLASTLIIQPHPLH